LFYSLIFYYQDVFVSLYLRKIFEAASCNNVEFVHAALQGAYGEQKPEDLELALIRAANNGHKVCVNLLLEHKVNVAATNGNEDTALVLAAQNGHLYIAKLLLDHGCPINHQNSMGYNALMKACENGSIEIVDMLLKHGAIDVSDDIGAEHTGKANGVSKLPQYMPHGYTSLMVTVLKQPHDYKRIAKMLLEANFNPNEVDLQDMTVLHHAANKSTDDVIELLIESKADANAKDVWGVTPLMTAVAYGKVSNVQMLLKHGADVKVTCKARRMPLSIAARTGTEDMVSTLVQAGADLDARDAHGHTPLFIAILHNNYEAVRCLIQSGCDLDIVCRDMTSFQMMTCFQCALHRKNVRLVEMLYQCGSFRYKDIFDALASETLKEQNSENSELIELLKTLVLGPQSLRSSCRSVIRSICSNQQSWVDSVAKMKLPKAFQDFLLYADLHIPVVD